MRGQKPLPAVYPRELRTLGDHLRKRRLELGLLQREVAVRLGVDKTTVYNWERNRTNPAGRFLTTVAGWAGYNGVETFERAGRERKR